MKEIPLEFARTDDSLQSAIDKLIEAEYNHEQIDKLEDEVLCHLVKEHYQSAIASVYTLKNLNSLLWALSKSMKRSTTINPPEQNELNLIHK